jgi:structure-specific endonuclease subunit SLX1
MQGTATVKDKDKEQENDQSPVDSKPWFCYMLASTDGRKTYVGATVDPNRRLRQHNGEISGGARATKGRVWTRRFLIGGFEEERAALRFEWRWKYLTRQAPGDSFMERRSHALSLLLSDFPFAEVLEG